jgi:hypothetical protein
MRSSFLRNYGGQLQKTTGIAIGKFPDSGQLGQGFVFNAQALHDRGGGMPVTPLGVDMVGQRLERGCQEEGRLPRLPRPCEPPPGTCVGARG